MWHAVRMGVMGCASVARRRVVPAAMASPDIEITTVASRSMEKAEKFAALAGCRAVHGYERLLEMDDIDAVYIPLPSALHAFWAERALRAGKHVLVEKPLTTDPARTGGLLELARARNLVLRENVMFVHHRQHGTVRRLLRDGAIGRLHAFHATFAVPELPADDIRYRHELGGGALLDVGLYPVRAAIHFLGDPEQGPRMAGAVGGFSERHGVDTKGAVLLTAAGDVSALLTFGLEHDYRSVYELHGSEGRLTVPHAFTPPGDHRPVLRLERGGKAEEIRLPCDDQVANTLASFATAIRAGGAGGEADWEERDCLRQALLLDAIREATTGAP